MGEAPTIRVTLSQPAFKALLQRGIGIPDGHGTSVREFLQRTLGIDPAYVEEQLQTVFLDGHPVDDFDRARVRPGAVLALSGAMPGLAGATMRRGGYYARMREGITHAGAQQTEGRAEAGVVIVKLFNRALADLAETLANRPLLVPGDAIDGLDPEAAVDGWVLVDVALADMTITVKCFASLTPLQPKNAEAFPVARGETVARVMERLGIPKGGAALIFVNNVHQQPDTVLRDGDAVGFFPPIGGG
jgi:molybdopterin converting factor small subunit